MKIFRKFKTLRKCITGIQNINEQVYSLVHRAGLTDSIMSAINMRTISFDEKINAVTERIIDIDAKICASSLKNEMASFDGDLFQNRTYSYVDSKCDVYTNYQPDAQPPKSTPISMLKHKRTDELVPTIILQQDFHHILACHNI